MAELILPKESYAIVGACFEVYNQMGHGFLEPVYQECLALEFERQKIPFRAQAHLPLHYREQLLQQSYRGDFICYDQILVEIKAVSALIDEHRSQLLNYLHATGLRLGLLVNFGHHPRLEYERLVI
jgi:GxxExxY protein